MHTCVYIYIYTYVYIYIYIIYTHTYTHIRIVDATDRDCRRSAPSPEVIFSQASNYNDNDKY